MRLDSIEAPFTKEQVDNLNEFQNNGQFHSFTCCSPENTSKCERTSGKSEGVLTATEQGWICPCGEYKQNWAHSFMSEKTN